MTETLRSRNKTKDTKSRYKIEKRGAFSFREIPLFQLVNTTPFSSLPPAVLHNSVKLCIVFCSTRCYLNHLSDETFPLLALICPDCDSPAQSRGRVRALEFWLAALNVSNETTLPPSTSWRQMFSHTILCRLLKSPQWHPEEVISAQNTDQNWALVSQTNSINIMTLVWVLFEKLRWTSTKQLTALTKVMCSYLGSILP